MSERITDVGYRHSGGISTSLFFNLNYILPKLGFFRPEAFLGCLWALSIDPESSSTRREYDFNAAFPARVKKLYGITFRKHEGEGKNAWESVEKKIDEGCPVILAADNYYLSHRPAFSRVHAGRTIILEQIDRKESIAYLRDLWTPACRVGVPFEQLWAAWDSKNPQGPNDNPFFSGYPINRAWFEVTLTPEKLVFYPDTLVNFLREDLERLRAGREEGGILTGIQGFERFKESVESWRDIDFTGFKERCRNAYLQFLNMASHRVFLRNLLLSLGRWLEDPQLSMVAGHMDEALCDWSYSRDLFAKYFHLEQHDLVPRLVKALGKVIESEKVCADSAESWLSEDEAAGMRF